MSDAPRIDIVAALAPVLAAVPAVDHPLLLALLERWAAERYRGWADDADEAAAELLVDCAAREEEIANRVQALRSDAAEVQAALVAAHPDLRATTDAAFAGAALDEQYALQAAGERLGAATWRAFASAANDRGDANAAETFTACAALEEASAEVLEALLAARAPAESPLTATLSATPRESGSESEPAFSAGLSSTIDGGLKGSLQGGRRSGDGAGLIRRLPDGQAQVEVHAAGGAS